MNMTINEYLTEKGKSFMKYVVLPIAATAAIAAYSPLEATARDGVRINGSHGRVSMNARNDHTRISARADYRRNDWKFKVRNQGNSFGMDKETAERVTGGDWSLPGYHRNQTLEGRSG